MSGSRWRGFAWERRRTQKNVHICLFVLSIVVFVGTTLCTWLSTTHEIVPRRRVTRSVSYEDCDLEPAPDNASSGQFPPDLFSLSQRRDGAVALHLAGLVYMFVALAVVCDEFFVPSLSVLIDHLAISEDVAGATFMAAGGSAPEFFTSVFGVFVAQNNVGIGTIVGSATFNILCVLACCALFSREVLHLTWWPLFRDMTFYIIALLFLVNIFSDEKISWDEALTMFLLYVIYGLFMKYNAQMESRVKGWLKMEVSSAVPVQLPTTQLEARRTSIDGVSREHRRSIPMIHGGQQLRSGLAHMAIGSDDESEFGSNRSLSSRESNSSRCSKHSKKKVVRVEPAPDKLFLKSNPTVPSVSASVEKRNSSKIAPIEVHSQPDPKTTANNVSNGNAKTFLSPDTANGVEANGRNHIHIPPLAIDTLSLGSSSEVPLDLSWPETALKRFIYVLLAPIMFTLAYTLPDVRNPAWKKWFIVSFLGAILWIAFYSYLMVWWANTIGETFGIPTEIMGLTILAAGTSIPDLITSVIVARKGLGDMAVSSSIGSNLFDICIGLPIPWLLFFIIALFGGNTGPMPTVSVASNGLICSVGLLFLMLVVLVISIALSGWKMDKLFGFAMIFAYILFCFFSIFLETGYVVCPLRTIGHC